MASTDDVLWDDYAARKRAARLQEAEGVWAARVAAGAGPDTLLVLDFVHFGASPDAIEALRRQLAEHYTVDVRDGPTGYRLLVGTTRPFGVTLSSTQHAEWVAFMCDVAWSHGCTFASWALTDPGTGTTIRSESFGEA